MGEHDRQIVQLIEYFVSRDARGGFFIDIYCLQKLIDETPPHIFQRYPLLCDMDRELLLYRASMLIEMNDPGEVFTLYFSLQNPHQFGTVAHRLTSLRHLFFPYLKREQLKNLTEMLELNEEDEAMTSITLTGRPTLLLSSSKPI